MACGRFRKFRSTHDRPLAITCMSTPATSHPPRTGKCRRIILVDQSLPVMDSSALLAAVARLVAEGTALAELVPRLAVLLRDVAPFERLHVLRLDRAESVIL